MPCAINSIDMAAKISPINRVTILIPIVPSICVMLVASFRVNQTRIETTATGISRLARLRKFALFSEAIIMLLMAPGPASSGILRGTIAIALRSAMVCASSGVCLAWLCLACIILIDINKIKMPPPTWNDGMEMLKKFKISPPKKVAMPKTLKTVMATTFAVCVRSCFDQWLVALIKIGKLPMGFTIAKSATPVLKR